MAGPVGLPVIDTMIGFPHEGTAQYDFIRKQTKDRESKEDFDFPVEYMFKDVPKGLPTDDPVSLLLQQMDRFGIEKSMIGVSEGSAAELALKMFPDRFIASGNVNDPNDVMGTVNNIRREYETYGIRAVSCFPSGTFPRCRSTIRRCTRSTRRASNWGCRSFVAPVSPGRAFRWRRKRFHGSTS